jgi:hypothetical protein
MLLQIILHSILYAAVSAEVDHPAASKAASKEAKAAAKAEQDQKLQQQQLAVSLLEELLPPTVASLVQCVERAAAAKQLQQQLLLWAGPVTSLPATLLAGSGSASAGSSTAAVDLPADSPPVALLLALLSTPPRALLHVVQTLDLLPPLRVLAGPVALQQRLRQGLRLPQQIVQFEQRAAGMAASSRQRLIQAITAQLQRGASELYVQGGSAASSSSRAVVAAAAGSAATESSPAGSSSGNSRRASSVDNLGTGTFAAAGGAAAAAGSEQQRRIDPSVVAAAFRLAKLGSQLGDKGVTELAGHLLALAGPVDPNVITFDAAAAAAADGSSGSDSSGKEGLAARTAFPMRAVLQHLVNCMFDQRPQVVAVAQSTLNRLLATPEAAAELKCLQDSAAKAAAAAADKGSTSSSSISSSSDTSAGLLCSYLSIFLDKNSQSTSNFEVDCEAAVQALAAAASPALWSPVGKPFDSWLCQLCSTLLTACSAAEGSAEGCMLLQMLADAAALQSNLAELLLPHALLALCTSDNSGADLPGIGSVGLSARLGAAIKQGLQLDCSSSSSSSRGVRLPGSSGLFSAGSDDAGSSSSSSGGCYTGAAVNVRCLSVLLSCLEHARIVHRAAMLAPPGTSQLPPPAGWQRCYCVHISYLAVAAAAISCKAYFTALLYIEHWCEEQYGKLTLNPAAADTDAAGGVQLQHLQQLQQLAGLGSTVAGLGGTAVVPQLAGGTTAVQQQQQQLLEAMLLDLYSNMNEPDGIYAVAAAFSSPASQLHLLQHEQRWASVLGAEDAQLQAAAVQLQQMQGLAQGNTGMVPW